jgi:hypothetical protein
MMHGDDLERPEIGMESGFPRQRFLDSRFWQFGGQSDAEAVFAGFAGSRD